jgi:hypothetical protein
VLFKKSDSYYHDAVPALGPLSNDLLMLDGRLLLAA